MAWIVKSQNYVASAGDELIVDTTADIVQISLPASPSIGDSVAVADYGNFSVNSCMIDPNGGTIEGSDNNIYLNKERSQYLFLYNGETWKQYDLSIPRVKIAELDELSTSGITDQDFFVVVDSENDETKKSSVSDMRNALTANLYSDIEDIVEDLNTRVSLFKTPYLNVLRLDGNSGSYYLDYDNFTNTPDIPTKTSDLTNDGSPSSLGEPYVTNLNSFTSDDLLEGDQNLYFTEDRFLEFFDSNFAQSFRAFTNDLAEDQTFDSEEGISGTPTRTDIAWDVINVGSNVSKFLVGQDVRIFGASLTLEDITDGPEITNAQKSTGSFTGGDVGTDTVSYKVAAFDIETGKISAASTESSTITGIDFEKFNQNNTIEVTLSRSSGTHGILIYRRLNTGTWDLIDVLGSKDLGPISNLNGIVYTDFGNFNNNYWTLKNAIYGYYEEATGTIHAPLTAPNTPTMGWTNVQISAIDEISNTITLNQDVYFEPGVLISHDDTLKIQTAIEERLERGIGSLSLNDRTYNVRNIKIPAGFEFTLRGKGRNTVLKKLSWSTTELNGNKIVYYEGSNADNINIQDMTIDGNMQNQWLVQDDVNPDKNYSIVVSGSNLVYSNIQVRNMIGGGIYSPQPTKLSMNISRIENSGMSDYYEYSPLKAADGFDVIVTSSFFKNFSDSIDLSTTDNGVFTSNFVENCGSGVEIYGSRYFVSSPNVIKGPAGEYIPGPDIINSEFDQVNITLTENNDVTLVAKYQENGQDFDLTANRAYENGAASINYRVYKLLSEDNVEQKYEEILIANTSPISGVTDVAIDPTVGEFKFTITSDNVNELLSTYSHTALKAELAAAYPGNDDITFEGKVYEATLTEYVPSGLVKENSQSIGTPDNKYNVTVTDYSNLAIGKKVVFLNHGGDPNFDDLGRVGTITDIQEYSGNEIPEADVEITYDSSITTAGQTPPGEDVYITIKNEFVLVKGKLKEA